MAQLAFRPFAPGVLLMRRLRLSVKLSLMGLMLLVPMAVLVATLAMRTGAEIDVASRELVGARQVSALIDLIAGLQAHRDLSSHGNDEAAKARRGTVLASMKAKIDELNAPSAPLLSADAANWPALQQAVAALADGSAPKQRDELFDHHSRAIALAIHQLDLTAEASGLLLDPVAESYYRMDLAVDRVAPWLEALSVARGKGTAILHRGEATTQDRANLLIQAEAIERAAAGVQTRIASLERLGQPVPAEWTQASAASAKLVAQIRREFTQDAISAEPGAFFDLASAALDAGVKLKQSVVGTLVGQLEVRVKEGRFTMARDLACAALGVGAVAYLALSFYLSFAGAVRALHRGVEKVLGGDLSQRIVIDGRDEMSEIGTMVERMNERLSSLVAEIRSSAVRVTMSGEQVAAGSQSLAERTEQQAASLRETVVTVQQLSAAVAQNADEASRLDQLTARLRDQAEAAGTEMNDSIQAMGALEDGSRRVGEIIGVIDSIAFQTNILALNAAVEAARAGEAGRGFAVVATEVRQLAQRSAAAAGEIRTLIARSSEQVDVSVRRTRDVGDVLTSLVDGVRSVSKSLQTIAEASARQSADLQGVTQSVGNLDEITRQNADAVGQSTAAAGELVSRAGALRESVAMIRLRQGSADEARELVNRALALIKTQGLHGAAPALHSKEEGFVDRDLYVFVIDRVGRYVVHGAKPAMEGKRVHDVPGIDGDRFVRESWEAAAANEGRGGWVEYEIVNPGTGAVQPKVSFVMPLDAERFIGCGIYRVQSAAMA